MTTAATTRLVPPPTVRAHAAGPAAPLLDPVQRDVVARVAAGTDPVLLVTGAPGTGRTTVALEAAAAAVEAGLAPDDVLVLAASRRAAGDLRDRLAVRLGRTSGRPLVQTAAAVAFAVLRARAGALGEPPPVLVSGPEQDRALAELLAGHAAGEVPGPVWPAGVPAEARTARAFRDELRDLLMRAAERGLAPPDLAALGRRHGRPAWVAAAALYAEYLDVMALAAGTPDAGERLDPAVVVDAAVAALRGWDDEVPGVPCPQRRLVVVDDHQESTAATARLLRAFLDRGARLLLLGDPDVAVQTFRGADPSLVARATADGTGTGELGARQVVLPTVWRQTPALRAVTARLTERIGAVGTAAHRRATTPAGRPDGPAPRVAVLPSGAQEAAWVAHELRTAHLRRGVPWDEMAVVARSGARVTVLRRALAQAGVPVRVVGSDVPLREEPAVRPLLDAVRVAVGEPLDAETAARLACSPLGGLDSVGLRRVRRALRAEELAGGGGRSSDALLVEVLEAPGRAATLPPHVARPVERLAAVLDAGRQAVAAPGADVEAVLWAVWHRAGLADPWRRVALAGGAAGERVDRDLDAVLALFKAAEVFVDRNPQATPGTFVEWVLAQDLPADSLAASSRAAGVSVLTPAGAAGRSWDVVAVVGVQDGAWPDLRLRDSLLGAQALVDVVTGRASAVPAGAGPATAAGGDTGAARAAVLADELRSFTVAVSRARTHLLVTAVDDQDASPSPFLDLVQPPTGDGPDPRRASAPAPLDLRGLVARLRATLERTARETGTPDAAAARTLARLARAGVPGAHPDAWFGLAAPSSTAPLWAPEDRVPVSPSRLETAQRCTLRWALESAGGTPASSALQSLGTLVHAIAQEHPTADRATLAAELDRRWPELGLGEGWPSVAARRRADAMVDRLATYLGTSGEPLLVEAPFTLETDRAVVRGSVDRVELVGRLAPDGAVPDGTVADGAVADGAVSDAAGGGAAGGDAAARERPVVRVVDLKTGSRVPTTAQAADHPQLGAYQLAVDAGAVPGLPAGTVSTGAHLVYLSQGSQKPTERRQASLGPETDGPSWARALVDEVADRMAASAFEARTNELCDRCPVRRACPLRGEGGQVVA
ncbi:ATP-dependent helicase [Cellulomonas shaoxiangyii]|uniref:DNA 3'-5' helicase n=1 Tax=Cellulomonas shaoxiangyii TaxID=2566013 RepID=A0A4P7SH93_9CELL|nr:UrvD/REP family ATP-dependent DNA helicase [Cellulomonas shaoxiangyii]QCB93038.1 ATP-dependent helicase [Cellulomonas shaoxiangyii]TGY84693.1 ATP-dependent helicase [Cellulomonas shaoxiangyii]